MKHQPEHMTLGEIISAIDASNTDAAWYEIIGIDELIDELDSAQDAEESEIIESQYIKDHKNDKYCVSWPDHVLTPRFNSDASYQG